MELHLFTSIISGLLKPWTVTFDTKFYNSNLTPILVNPIDNQQFIIELKRILGKEHEIFVEDSFVIYQLQPSSKDEYKIKFPLLSFPQLPAKNAQERFYFSIIKNESQHITQRLYDSISRDLTVQDRKVIVNTFYGNLKQLLRQIANTIHANGTPVNNHLNIIQFLRDSIIRLILETNLIYGHLLTTFPLDKYQIFHEILNIELPENFDEFIKPSSNLFDLISQLKVVESPIPLKKQTPPDALSFGFSGDVDSLKSVCIDLETKFEMLKAESTGLNLFNVLTSKQLSKNGPFIYLNIATQDFRYLIDQIKTKFTNLNPTSIAESGLFFSKDHPEKPLTRQNLYSSKKDTDTKNKPFIDSILKQLK